MNKFYGIPATDCFGRMFSLKCWLSELEAQEIIKTGAFHLHGEDAAEIVAIIPAQMAMGALELEGHRMGKGVIQ
jgi:hypothetical protein